ncbi:hypothetical protein VTL71DRAFT_4552 [Oculimacula yallundae]|uniref:Heterokaryon incompatibility domain-containing protein n=1 Tax=Oculimacula yallundae TaxID=86028 RepID=A0ABR4C4P9_9HELO
MFQGPSKQGDHHASFRNLTKAAQSGCKICKSILLFRKRLGPDEAGEQAVEPFITFSFARRSPAIHFSASVSWLADSMPWKEVQIHVSKPQPTPKWWSQFLESTSSDLLADPSRVRVDQFPSRHIPCNTGDTAVSFLALEWLNDCRNHHITCDVVDESRDSNFLPPRLLEISKGEPLSCRLLVSGDKGLVKGSCYVALSHCWGANPSIITLTADNMDRMRDNIPCSDLPKSFLKAIQTSQRLGFQYIWIDSLCTIQLGPGSEADWQLHSAQMDQIYANCELNIAVAHASDSTQGCFVDRDPEFIQTAYVYVPVALGLRSNYEDWISASYKDSFDDGGVSAAYEDSSDLNPKSNLVTTFSGDQDFVASLRNQHPLHKRAWVFQERLMAPRSLHFGNDRIFWECNEKGLSEYLPGGLPSFTTHAETPFSLPALVLKNEPTTPLDKATIKSLHIEWQELIDCYSRADLTYPGKDKLVAISAVAKRFGRVLPGPYTAGHFLSSNTHGLVWQNINRLSITRMSEDGWREHIYFDNRRDPVYRAPSWSWASVEGRTMMLLEESKDPHVFAEVKSVSVELVEPSNPYGQVRSAEIIVDGPMLPIRPVREQDIENQSCSQLPESFNDNDGLFALYIFTEEISQKDGSMAFGLVLTRVSADLYRRVGQICLIAIDRSSEFDFPKSESVRIV